MGWKSSPVPRCCILKVLFLGVVISLLRMWVGALILGGFDSIKDGNAID